MKLKEVLMQKNIMTGYLYFYIHLITELICFFALSQLINNDIWTWFLIFLYDALAFVPQSLIGYIKDKYPKINVDIIGTLLLTLGLIIFLNKIKLLGIIIISLANALIHIEGATTTLKSSNGKLSHSAIFVAGGSFGVALGKILGSYSINVLFLLFLITSMIPCIILANRSITEKSNCCNYNYHNKKLNPFLIVILATLVVVIRGYMGYGIPTTWNKTTIQMVSLFFTMGLGKALGGIVSDMLGMKKTIIISTLISIPFLIVGDNLMFLSLVGIMLFSMTMSITLGIITSVLKNNPGLSFGMTTIGLFLGTAPIFFIQITSFWINSLIVVICSILCLLILLKITDKEKTNESC